MATATLGLSEYESELLPTSELESEFESELALESESANELESEFELSPIRRVYPDGMMEHLAHEALESESEREAAEHFLPLIPIVASKLLPIAAKVLPKVASKVLPNVARAMSRVTPQLTRGISNITRTLFRNRQARSLVRAVPSIARRTLAQIARQTASGQPISPQTALQVLQQQARQVIGNPLQRNAVLRRSAALDRRFHQMTGIPWSISPLAATGPAGTNAAQRLPVCCRSCGQLITR